MTLATATNSNDYTGNGALGTYSYTFKALDQSHLVLTVADDDGVEFPTLTITTDYTVTGAGVVSGGTIVLVEDGQDWMDGAGNLKTGYAINIRRVVPLTQNTDIRNQGSFFPATYEDALDYITMIGQQLQEQLDRAVLAGPTESTITVAALSASIAAAAASEANAAISEANAADSETAAAASKNSAETAETNAETAETGAEAAQTAAEAAQTAAEAAQAAAEAAPALETNMSVIWMAAISAIPSGWVICDGNNGTDNMTDRFMVHADADSGGTLNPGDTGGVSTHALSEAELAVHDHDIPLQIWAGQNNGTYTAGTNHTTSAGTDATNNAGSGSAHTNRDKYNARPYIMKT